MSMSLDEVIHADHGGTPTAKDFERDPEREERNSKMRGRVQQAMEQMGLTSESRHVRKASKVLLEALSAEENVLHDPSRDDRSERRQERSAGEQVQRWLAYVLQHGYRELGVRVEEGWAFLDELAETMGRARPRFGLFDGDRLRALLEETDKAGRFEFDSTGRMRKVQKGGRHTRSDAAWTSTQQTPLETPAATPRQEALAQEQVATKLEPSGLPHLQPRCHAAPVGGEATFIPSSPSSPRSMRHERSPSRSMSPGGDGEDMELATVCRKSLHVSGDVMVVDAADAEVAAASVAAAAAEGQPAPVVLDSSTSGRPPPRPPGEHWTKYQDHGSFWWHYDGPLGTWWCSNGEEPEPY